MPQPNLGYGKPTEASIDQVNIWMRSTPWYQQQLRAWGQDPGHPTLNKSQSDQILRMAQANGVVVDQGGMEVDDHGNFNPKGHKLRNTLIVAGIAGATIATMGAAGAFAGAAGAGAGAGAGGAGTAAGMGGVSMGMSSALPGALASVPAYGGAAAGVGAGAGAGLAATQIGNGMVPAITGGTGLSGASGMGWGGAIKTGLDYYNKYSDVAQRLGEDASAIGQGRAAGRVQQAGLNNNQDFLRLQAAKMMEDALQGRAGLDLKQREFALQAPGMRAGNSVRGDALAGLQDVGVSGPTIHTHGQIPQITGGLRPSLLSANTRQLGSNMSRDALLQNMNGADAFQPLPPVNVPTITPMPQAGLLDKTLNGVGLAGGLGGDIMDFVNKYKSKQPDQQYPQVFPHPFDEGTTP